MKKRSKMNGAAITIWNLALALILVTPAIADESRRKPADPSGPFARLTGQITQTTPSDEGFGNGFIVGAEGCHVLTNFHVAFGKSANPTTGEVEMVDNVAIGHAVNFSFDLDPKTGEFRKTIRAKVVEFGNYELFTSRGFLGDLALLRLESCIGKDYGQLEIDRPDGGKRLPNGKLMTVSSARVDGKNEVLVEEGCRARPATAITGMMLSDCESVPGMSGSMILEEGPDRQWRLAGVTTGGGAYVNGRQISKAIYATALNKFLDSCCKEALVRSPAEQRKP